MRRRQFVKLMGVIAGMTAIRQVAAQTARPTLAVIHGISYDAESPRWAAFRDGLKVGGYVENQNVRVQYQSVTKTRTPKQLAEEVVARRPDVIFAAGSEISVAVKAATNTIPVVFASGGDPIKLGLVSSLNQPGQNVTGATRLSHGLAIKQLEVLREAIPSATLIGVIANDDNPNTAQDRADLLRSAELLGTSVVLTKAKSEQELALALDMLRQRRVGAVLIGNDPNFVNARRQILEGLEAMRTPAIFPYREFVDEGGLMSYGAHSAETYHQAGVYIGRILQGEKPGSLPVHQAVRIELIVNLKTARRLDITIPPALLARADEVIE